MSSQEPPYDADRGRSSSDDPTRYQDAPPPGRAPGPPPGEEHTQYLDPVEGPGGGREPLEATVHHGQGFSGDRSSYGDDPRYAGRGSAAAPAGPGPDDLRDEPEGRRWGKGFALVLLGLVLGFILAFVVVALGTDDASPTAAPSAAALERIDELEAELGEREAQIADLEAQLAEADADAGEADEAIAAQRDALDDRAAELDGRSSALNDREAAVAERERQVEAREAAVAERERAADEGEPAPDDDGFELPEIDDETVDGIVDQVLDRIRDLF